MSSFRDNYTHYNMYIKKSEALTYSLVRVLPPVVHLVEVLDADYHTDMNLQSLGLLQFH